MRFSTFLPIAALAAVASAAPSALQARQAGQCNTGPIQCCNQTLSPKTNATLVTGILSLLDVVVGDVTALVGLDCSPLNVIGSSGPACVQQPLCCNNISQNGLINIGCSPININL